MFRKLTQFIIDRQFEHFPAPLTDWPAIIPVEHQERLREASAFIWPVGSQTIEGAAHAESDHDFLVVSGERLPDIFDMLGCALLTGGGHYDPSEGDFNSWRVGDLNYVATDDIQFAKRFLVANELARRFRLTDKGDRIALFQGVLYGRTDPARAALRKEVA